MLLPDDRQTLIDALRPPCGFALDIAVGTSYSLNLDAALTPAAAFAVNAVSTERNSKSKLEPLELLDAIRRNSKRITIFFQSGQIPVVASRRLFLFLEDSLIPASAPNKGGIFHPKVWVARYSSGDGTLAYRMLCASRNLTHDRAWDTLLRLDSLPAGSDSKVKPDGLSKFIRALPGLAVHPLNAARETQIFDLAEELKKVRWSLPQGVDSARFIPLGTGTKPRGLFPKQVDRFAVVSPFLTSSFLENLPDTRWRKAIISTPEQLDAYAPSINRSFSGDSWVLDPDATPENEDAGPFKNTPSEDPGTQFHGLHAKLFVSDVGTRSTVLTGSANATSAAWQRNVEFMTELVGPRRLLGVEKLFTKPTVGSQTLWTFLTEYTPDSKVAIESQGMDELDALRIEIAGHRIEARAVALKDDRFKLSFTMPEAPALPHEVSWHAWPITLPPGSMHAIDSGEKFHLAFSTSFDAITPYLANEVRLGDGVTRFVLCAAMVEAPGDRSSRMLKLMLENSERLIRYLLMLLADERDDIFAQLELLKSIDDTDGRDWRPGLESLPLLEVMLRALARDPKRLTDVHRLMVELRNAAKSDANFDKHGLLDQIETIWEPIWMAAKGEQ